MSDQLNYDPFQAGDKVWCEMYGFGEIYPYIPKDEPFFHAAFKRPTYKKDSKEIAIITPMGNFWGNTHRPRTIFHAVADTDEGMREAIARGEGLRRTVPRGRWPIQPGDIVMHIVTGRYQTCAPSGSNPHTILAFGGWYKEQGGQIVDKYPQIIRLFEGEEPPETLAERWIFVAEEMKKYGWEEKHGGGK